MKAKRMVEKKFVCPKPEKRPERAHPTYTPVQFGGWRASRGTVTAYGATQEDACAAVERMEALLGSIPELQADGHPSNRTEAEYDE